MSWSYQDVWTGTGYRRQIQGSTLHVLTQINDSQLYSAAQLLHSYCTSFGYDGPIVIGRGCHNIWRPAGYASRGTRPVSCLEVYSPDMTREAFASLFAKTPDKRQYVPGEVVAYGQQGEMAVCLNGYSNSLSEIAVPLTVYSSADAIMAGYPHHIARQLMVSSSHGFNILLPLYGLIVALGQLARIWMDLSFTPINDASAQYWNYGTQWRQTVLEEDIHDFRYLCYSQAMHQYVRVWPDDPQLEEARQNVETYLRSFTMANDVYSEAARETATNHFILIGLHRGAYQGPRYDIPGQWKA
jgi:hypothetical protein